MQESWRELTGATEKLKDEDAGDASALSESVL